tara:strand:- start:672 stop:1070 length:399 start_codon:yes stop_codon:yes gene_type:complete
LRLDLDKIFDEALQDHSCVNLDWDGYEARMIYGVKIVRDMKTQEIQIFNPSGKDYNEELTSQEYEYFKNGWRSGVYDLVLESYIRKLDILEKKIAEEVTTKKANASINGFTKKRLSIMNKYYKITQKKNEQK